MIPLKSCTGFPCLVQTQKKFLITLRSTTQVSTLVCVFLVFVSTLKAQEKQALAISGFKDLKSSSISKAATKKQSSHEQPQTIQSTLASTRSISEKAIKKAKASQKFLTERAEKIIRQSQEAELKALQKLDGISQIPTEEFSKVKAFYDQMLSRIKNPVKDAGFAREYLPKMDSLLASSALLKSITGNENLDILTEKLKGLQGAYSEAAHIQKQISERLNSFIDRYKGKIPLKEVQRIKQISQTAKAQIQEFKNLIENPAPKVERLIDLAVQQQSFEGFFAQHAELSKLFKSPSLSMGSNQPDPGLQTVAQLEKQIEDNFGASGKSLLAKQQQNGQQAISGVQTDLLNSILGANSKSASEPQINTESVKPASKRLSFSTDIKSQRSNGWLPAYSEIGLNLGYRLSQRFIGGIGVSGRVGWGKGFSDFKVSMEGVGIRSFVDYKIKGGFYATGGFEAIYDPLPDLQSRVTTFSQWQKNGLIGLKKGFRIKNGFIKGASMKLMWNYLSYSQKGIVPPFDFRIGYDF
jgi:hypothetical protein